ncbi:hypothetical protein TNCV_1376821 [Trichonephila clavipes]|nr:hypothetical protein TNCV_1376821 [Trichonephila clavipes]
MPSGRTPRACQLASAGSLRVSESLTLKTVQRIWYVWPDFAVLISSFNSGSIRVRIQWVNPPPHICSTNPTAMSLRDTEERYHQPIDRSRLTPAFRLQRSVGQRYSQDTIFLLTGHRTWQTCGLAKQRR